MYGCCTQGIQARGPSRDTAIFLLLITNAGLFMVDHIHFQVWTGNHNLDGGGRGQSCPFLKPQLKNN